MNDGSLGSIFDFDTQVGVMELLASIRASQLDSNQKNELRDLVFLYINGGKDNSIKISLEQKIANYHLNKVKISATKTQTSVATRPPTFGTYRQAPTFAPAEVKPVKISENAVSQTSTISSVTSQPTVSVTASVAGDMSSKKVDDKSAGFDAKTNISVTEQVNVETVSAPIPKSYNQATQPQDQVVVTDSVKLVSNETANEAVSPGVNDSSPVQTTVAPTVDNMVQNAGPANNITPDLVQSRSDATPQYEPFVANPATEDDMIRNTNRIKQIKSEVNEKIGNPVNLIDINNDVGREYLSALLDAMKKVNGGSSAVSAMTRLESAFASVQKTLVAYESKKTDMSKNTDTVSVSTPNIDVAPVPAPTPTPTPTPTLTVKDVPKKTSINEISQNVTPNKTDNVAQIESVTSEPNKVENETAEVNQIVDEIEQPTASEDVKKIAVNNLVSKLKSQTSNDESWGPASDTIIKDSLESESRISSINQSPVKPKTLNDVMSASDVKGSSISGDPLYTKDVDDGLHQLLSEWSIFKKSGLFGTGPKGREHPLYKKVANLQIPLLLAGRFEGATQEIKQSVTDYMNGWRYEQGIIYEQGENFEHYLRRIIRHILDLQNSKRTS